MHTPAAAALCLIAFTFTPAAGQTRIEAGTDGRDLPAPARTPVMHTIAILPDRTAGRDWGMPYLEQAVEDLNRVQPQAVFTIGDMVQGYTRSMTTYDAQSEAYLRVVGGLAAPFYPIAGNHDVISGFRSGDDHQFEDRFKDRFGPLYYAARFDFATVIALYSDEQLVSAPRFGEAQIDWASRQIMRAAEAGHPIIVLMHKPTWRYPDSQWDRIHARLAEAHKAGVKVIVVAGHFHSLQRDEDRDGVEYHMVGTCGGMIDQGPLAGQLQHLTFLRVGSEGDVKVYHQGVGATLPDDFILAEDQNRAFRLKSEAQAIECLTVLDQPVRGLINDVVQFKFTNPIDVPIEIAGGLVTEAPTDRIVDGWTLVDRTQRDIFNPFVTDLHTPFEQVREMQALTIAPGDSATVALAVRCEAQPRMIMPPEFNFTATFKDSRGRRVPVVWRCRVPLRMRAVVGAYGVVDMLACSWRHDVYDLPEPNPQIGLSVHEGNLNIAIAARDDLPCYLADDDATARVTNPVSDAVVLRIGEGEKQAVYLIEPMTDDAACPTWRATAHPPAEQGDPIRYTLEREAGIIWTTIRSAGGYGVVIQVPLEAIGRPGAEVPFNIEIADNDDTYHTQWRRWADPKAGSTIILPNRF